MTRYALKIEYHGGPFVGWQRQAGLLSVQSALEAALRKLELGCQRVTGAGRTDAGVHARGQVAHVDLDRDWEPFRLCAALNFHLKPLPVAVLAAVPVAGDFHARFSAIGRQYEYRLISRRAPLTFDDSLAWRVGHALSLEAMRAGAGHLIGRHDFTTFRSTLCQAKSPVKTLDAVEIVAAAVEGGTEFTFTLQARSFLHNQVRSIVGTLERAGSGAWTPDRVRVALEARDRAACGPVAPPQGLYLVAVVYETDVFAG
jgi:tRNA pseudouridine38-40 synthase